MHMSAVLMVHIEHRCARICVCTQEIVTLNKLPTLKTLFVRMCYRVYKHHLFSALSLLQFVCYVEIGQSICDTNIP